MSITIEDFNNNFIMQVRTIDVPHINGTGTIPASIGFNVVCKLNNRVQYFESHIMDQIFVDIASTQDLLDYAWVDKRDEINTWATTAITETSLIGYIYTPLTEFVNTTSINLSTYNSNYITSIARFEVYPGNDPSGWCVGFGITNIVNKEYMYIDTNFLVDTFAVTIAENELMENAWVQIKDMVAIWAADKMTISSFINTTYVPTEF
jgi:hypothetical protein